MARPLNRLAAELGDLGRVLRSRGVVLGCIGTLLSLYGLGLVIPQRLGVDPETWVAWRRANPRLVGFIEAAQLDDVYTSGLAYAALAVFFASLLAVLWDRVPRLVRATRTSHGVPLEAAAALRRKGAIVVEVAPGVPELARAEAVLEARGYRLLRGGDGFRAVRFRFAPLGFVLFHGAFVLLLAAGIALDLTRFSARVRVAEGESFDAARGPYLVQPRLPRVGPRYPELAFTVLAIRELEESGAPVGLEADLLLGSEGRPSTARVNEPVERGHASLLVVSAGVAPLFTCEVNGVDRDGAYVKLVSGGDAITRFFLPACELDVLARSVGAPARPGARDAGGVMLRASPSGAGATLATGLELAVRAPGGEIARGVVRPGGTLATPDGRVLRVREGRRYAEFQLVHERGGGLLWAAFVAALVGLVARLVLYRREIVVVTDGARAAIVAVQDTSGVGTQSEAVQAVADVLRAAGVPVAREA